MRIVNSTEVVGAWNRAVQDRGLVGIIFRHAAKGQGLGDTWAGLSERGFGQRDSLFRTLQEALSILRGRGVRLVSSTPCRNIQTIAPLMEYFRVPVILTAELWFPELDADMVAARKIAAYNGINVKEAFRRLEEFGIKRIGEHPDSYRARFRDGIVEQVNHTQEGQVLMISGNFPVMGEAVLNLKEEVGELEAVFFARTETLPYRVLGRAKPEFED